MRDLLSIFTELIPSLIAVVINTISLHSREFVWDVRHGSIVGRGMKISLMVYAPMTKQWLVRYVRARFIIVGEIYTNDLESVRLADENITWCRGWEGEAVEAIQAVRALA